MSDPYSVIDTDILSALMRRDARALARASHYLSDHPRLTFSIITRYEILRGLRASGASGKLRTFEQFCSTCEVLPLTDEVVVCASGIYADLHQKGQLIGDADILIAATAVQARGTMVTNNHTHFRRIGGLTLDNWLV